MEKDGIDIPGANSSTYNATKKELMHAKLQAPVQVQLPTTYL